MTAIRLENMGDIPQTLLKFMLGVFLIVISVTFPANAKSLLLSGCISKLSKLCF
jgi:hypothetical protein